MLLSPVATVAAAEEEEEEDEAARRRVARLVGAVEAAVSCGDICNAVPPVVHVRVVRVKGADCVLADNSSSSSVSMDSSSRLWLLLLV